VIQFCTRAQRPPRQKGSEASAGEGHGEIDRHASDVKEQPEEEDLQCRRARGRVDELRQEGDEEERDFGIEKVGDDALAIDGAERQRHRCGCRPKAPRETSAPTPR